MPTSYRLMLQARLVLAAFLLSLGVAVAAPALRPAAVGAFEWVCAGGVMKRVERSVTGSADPSALLDRAEALPPARGPPLTI